MISARPNRGFTLVEIMIVVAIIGILLAIALPGFIRARERSRQTACQENLSKLDMAISQYVLEENILGTTDLDDFWGADWPTHLCGEDLYVRNIPECPSGGTYRFARPDDYEPVWCSLGTRDPEEFPHRMVQILSDPNAPAARP